MSFKVVELVLGSSVATSGTFTVGYPDGTTRGTFVGGTAHKMTAGNDDFVSPTDFTVALGAANATVTYNGATTIPAGTRIFFQFDESGADDWITRPLPAKVVAGGVYSIELGSPAAIDTDGVCKAQSGAAGPLDLDGDLVVNGVAVLDVPRNLIADSGGTDDAVLTITGTDEYGDSMVETITLNDTTAVAGKKAFKTVTSVVSSKTIANGAFLGTGDVLGLPVRLPSGAHVLKELEDGAAASAGTIVAGLAQGSASTATSADVRGTYDPASACDGDAAFTLIVALTDPTALGNPQYAG